MLKYTTVLNNEDGIISPSHHRDLEFTRPLDLSAGSKAASKMAIKRKAGRKLSQRELRETHLPPINQSNSPSNLQMSANLVPEKREPFTNTHLIRRKEIRTPYVSHMAMSRANEVVTPYVLHTQITNIDSQALAREATKLSGNVVEVKPDELRHERTFSSLQKLPSSSSPIVDKRPKGRHGRPKNFSFNDHDYERNGDIKELTIQSNQMGLYRRSERRPKEVTKGRTDESFSIRKKIEQFRKWHEEQYREKIKKLKQEVDHQFEAEHSKMNRQVGNVRETPTSKTQSINVDSDKNEKAPSEKATSSDRMEEDKVTPNNSTGNDTSKPRNESARTWRTWRNVNESYAYNDVNKYIQEDRKSVV